MALVIQASPDLRFLLGLGQWGHWGEQKVASASVCASVAWKLCRMSVPDSMDLRQGGIS